MKKRIFCIALCLFLLFSLTACGSYTPVQKSFNEKVSTNVPSTDETIAQNDKYRLEYDSANGGVRLVENSTGTAWDLCPTPTGGEEYDDLGMPIKRHGFPQSVLEVGYMDVNISGGGNMATTTYDSVLDGSGRMVLKEIENGITVEYYFDTQKFMIPVDYVLCDDYLSISVDSTKIQENDFRIVYVSIAPFLCSVENDTPDSYLFMPSGSGALLSADSFSDQGLVYKSYIYGDDLTMEERYDPTNEKSVRLPVYGYKSGNKGGFSIIDNGADTVLLSTTCGNTLYKFSAIYPSFQLRGYTNHESKSYNSTSMVNVYPNNMVDGKFSIRFYPLSGENANYNEMANIYRDYLVNENGLKENTDEKAMSVSIIGGTQVTKSFLGIPYKTVYATTTFDQTNKMISEISDSVDSLAVKLKGFGANGFDIASIGGSYKINSSIGSVSKLKNISKTCTDRKIDLYMDFDLVRFNSSGSGFSYFSDGVMNSGIIKADQYIFDKAVRTNDEDHIYRLLKPEFFSDAVSKIQSKTAKWNYDGVSLETLTSLSYSDYSNYSESSIYNSKYGFSTAVSEAISKLKDSDKKLMATDANVYAAAYADIITDAPVSSDKGYAFFEDVPFYEIVFKGYVPMTTEAINLATNPQKAILGAVESGIGLNYTLISQWDNDLINAVYPQFYSTVYSGVKDNMLSCYANLSDYYKDVKGAKIVSNTVISSGVHCTVFDNGVTVYVNYNDYSVQTPAGEIGALDYIVSGGAAQ